MASRLLQSYWPMLAIGNPIEERKDFKRTTEDHSYQSAGSHTSTGQEL